MAVEAGTDKNHFEFTHWVVPSKRIPAKNLTKRRFITWIWEQSAIFRNNENLNGCDSIGDRKRKINQNSQCYLLHF